MGFEPVKHGFPLRQRDTKRPLDARSLGLWKVSREITRYPFSGICWSLSRWGGSTFILRTLFYKSVEIEATFSVEN